MSDCTCNDLTRTLAAAVNSPNPHEQDCPAAPDTAPQPEPVALNSSAIESLALGN